MPKYNLPSTLIGEKNKYIQLYELPNRTTTGNLSFTSTTSAVTYSSTSGEEGLLLALKNALKDYFMTAEEINIALQHPEDAIKHITAEERTNWNGAVTAVNGLKFRNNNGFLEWSLNGTTWNSVGGTSDTTLTADASNSLFSGVKKGDTLTWGGQCVYANTVTSGSVQLTDISFNNLRLGRYALMVRLKSANNSLTTDAIRLDVQKNTGGVFSSISIRNIKANEFKNITDYQCFYIDFEYKGVKATNNQLKFIVTLLTQSSAYEVDLDYIQITPVGMGIMQLQV
jgi:hypothetical protein